jgi:predicted permease
MTSLGILWSDLRFTARSLRKSPGFAVVLVLTLALSIGANSAIFSVVEGVMLRSLPYPQADRIVRVFYANKSFPKFPVNHFDLRDFRERNRLFENLAAYTRTDAQLSGEGEPVNLAGFRVTAGYFGVLGLHPALGREFDRNDELPGSGAVAVLSDRVWRTRFGGAPDILGRKVTLEATPVTVVGIMPPGTDHPGNEYNAVAYGETVDVWRPFTFGGNPNQRGSHYVEGIGRIKSGVSPEQAQGELNALMAEIAKDHPAAQGWQILVNPLQREIVGSSRRMLLVLLGAVALVLLVACANAANLLLARAIARQREIAVRAALGAGTSRLIRQMLAESLCVSVIGGGLGALFAVGGVRVLVSWLPAGFPRAADIHVNAEVLAFTLVLSLTTGLVFGLAPALQALRTDLQQGLREGSQGSGGSVRRARFRSMLVAGEVGLACVLLIGAGLLLRSFGKLLQTDPGFRPNQVLTCTLTLPRETYKRPEDVARFYTELLNRLNALPSVQVAGAGSDVPWTGYDDNLGFEIEGKKPAPNEDFHARYHVASPEYFRSVGIPLVRGRLFSEADAKDAPRVILINDSMARRYWPGEDPVGRRISFDSNPKEEDWMRVVGVVGDVKDRPDSTASEPALWWPVRQQPWSFSSMVVVARSKSDAGPLVNQLRTTVRELDPSLAVADIRLMDQIADAALSARRFALFLVALFAVLALVLAAIGVYGVMAYSVNQRMPEFGMRMALGAGSWDVLRLVLWQGLKVVLAGTAFGLACAAALGRVLGSLLYEVSGVDPFTFASVALALTFTAILACYLPARRAAEADPMAALRSE